MTHDAADETPYWNYNAIVPDEAQDHVAAILDYWATSGHPADRVPQMVKSLVLYAYALGADS